MSVPFTQYLRPDGRKQQVNIQRPEAIQQMANKIIEKGYRFACEELPNGTCSFTVTGDMREGDIAIKLCRNGPDVPNTIDLLVREAYVKVMGYRTTKGARKSAEK